MHIDHIAISVGDLQESILFYSKYFVRREIKRYTAEHYTIVFGESVFWKIEMFEFEDSVIVNWWKTLLDELQVVWIKHLALQVSDSEFDDLYKKFLDDDVVIFQEPKQWILVQKYFFIKDPNNISIEFLVV